LRLPLRRKFLEIRIVLERLALLVGGKILVAAEPVTGVVLDDAFIAEGFFLFLLRLTLLVLSLPGRSRYGTLGKCRSGSQIQTC
jgi:hypothetical protein